MTIKGRHQKHPPLARPDIGMYHRSEWAIYGTSCDAIARLHSDLTDILTDLRLLYVDADHGPASARNCRYVGAKRFVSHAETMWNAFDDRLQDFLVDAVLVNGNHYPARQQIVIIDPSKEASLRRREEQLTDIRVVLCAEETDIYDFVRARMSEDTIVLPLNEREELGQMIRDDIRQRLPALKAVVLAGGKSARMGEDKSQIIYHAHKTQEQWLIDLLKECGLEVYLSKSYDHQGDGVDSGIIRDRYVDMGPFGAIMSAMMTDPDAAWLVLAVDLPLLDRHTITRLIAERAPRLYATAYKTAEDAFPEPLVAIYEPRSYQRFLRFLSLGYACPRKVLINSPIKSIMISDTDALKNVNTPEEREDVQKDLNA